MSNLETAADIVAAVGLISKVVEDGTQIMKLFSAEDLTEEEVEKILNETRARVVSYIENNE